MTELRLALEDLIDVLERLPISGPSDPRELPLARARRALARTADR